MTRAGWIPVRSGCLSLANKFKCANVGAAGLGEKMTKSWIILALVLALAGCQTASTTGGLSNQQRIQQDVPANYRVMILQFIQSSLKDPYSVRSAGITQPFVGFVGLVNGTNAPVVCARFNARNSFGAYGGISSMAFVFRNGSVLTAIPDGAACANAVYGPFPELGPAF
jgi:hypothetical protein